MFTLQVKRIACCGACAFWTCTHCGIRIVRLHDICCLAIVCIMLICICVSCASDYCPGRLFIIKTLGRQVRGALASLQLRNVVVAMWDLVQVQLHQQLGININNVELEKFARKPCVIHPGSAALPLQWFECQPVVSKRLAIMTMYVTSKSYVTVVWAGDVWVYRGLLRAAGATSWILFFYVLIR